MDLTSVGGYSQLNFIFSGHFQVAESLVSPQVRFAHTVENDAFWYEANLVIVDERNDTKHKVKVQILVTVRQAFVIPKSDFYPSDYVV